MPAESLDPRGIRFTAAITCLILALALVTQSGRVMAVQTVLFGLCAFLGVRTNPWGVVFRHTMQPKLKPVDPSEREDPRPVQFSQGIGFLFSLVATVGYAVEWNALGLVANSLALIAALLNAAFGYCLGCQLYLVVHRLVPARRAT